MWYHIWMLVDLLVKFFTRLVNVWFEPAYIALLGLMVFLAIRHILQAREIR